MNDKDRKILLMMTENAKMSKPWDGEDTPMVDEHSWVPYQSPRVVAAKRVRDLERRLRHAERLVSDLFDTMMSSPQMNGNHMYSTSKRSRPVLRQLRDHLAIAKEADNE